MTPLALACVVCESCPQCPTPQTQGDWQAQARFLLPRASELLSALEAAGLAGRGHPTPLSTPVSADLLFEDGDLTGETEVATAELPALLAHAPADMHAPIRAWHAFTQSLEQDGHDARLIVWFIR